MFRKVLIALLFAWGLAEVAQADPCEGPLPATFGSEFSGTVRYVIDGDGFCLGNSGDASTWIEVRTADFDAIEMSTPEGRRGKQIAEQQLMGRTVECRTAHGRDGHSTTSYDRVFATCTMNGRPVAAILREAGVPQGGN